MHVRYAISMAAALLLTVGSASFGQDKESLLRQATAAKDTAGRAAQAQGGIELPAATGMGKFTTFDVPGAGTAAYQGTVPQGINPAGVVTGNFTDTSGTAHGFIRKPGGDIIAFDPPGATGTLPQGINPDGAIAGEYRDAAGTHGFLRAPDGSFATIDGPGSTYTLANAINEKGAVTGFYSDANGVHGYLRAPDGSMTKLNVPAAARGFPGHGTEPLDLNQAGATVGTWDDNSELESHGFLRTSRGAFITINPPARGRIDTYCPFYFGHNNCSALFLNQYGVVAGAYFEFIPGNPFGGDYRVYIRYQGGYFVAFDGATYGPCCIWSLPTGINASGQIAGLINDGFSIFHGFIRNADATVATFDAPGAGTGFDQGTVPLDINPTGVMAGVYIDANNVNHGFLFTP